MTHPSFQTNGASLEDCHTNFFALTDLCGIKWRRLSAENVFSVDPLDDPVLLSFTKCLAADILCVWRRVQCTKGHPDHHHPMGDHPPQVGYSKELWIFWYGEEPDLSSLICSELQDMETGSWDSGLSYECRTLLFKALHNLIERCLISRDFVRLGKWFVQPYDVHDKSGKSPHLTFSFSFFLHGESTVCATVDVRQHPAVYQLSLVHLQAAQASHNGTEVILGPFGLNGLLTGQSYKDMDHSTQKLLDDWRQFFPIDPLLNNREGFKEGNALPSLVEVLVGGVRMRYPSCYVLVVEEDEVGLSNSSLPSASFMSSLPPQTTAMKVCTSSNAITSVAISSVSLTPPTSPCDGSVLALGGGNKPSAGPAYGLGGALSLGSSYGSWDINHAVTLSQKITSRVWQDGTGGNSHPPIKSAPSEGSPELDSIGHWDHADPTQKTGCNCSKCKKSKPPANQPKPAVSGASGNSQPGTTGKRGERNDKLDKQQQRHSRGITPFHRRSPINDELPVVDMELMSPRVIVPPNPSYQFKGSSTAAVPTGLPQLRTSLLDPISSGASPHSSAPSPLVASHSQPASVTQADPTMPTLSPHPPASKENDLPAGEESGPADTHDLPHSNTVISPLDLNKEGPKSVSDQVFSPYSTTPLDQNKTSDIINWTQSQGTNAAASETVQGLKRPCLPGKTYEDPMEDDMLSDRLYDYSTLEAWLSHPVKKFKLEPKTETKPSRPGSTSESQPSPMNTGSTKEQLDSPQSQQNGDVASSKTADPYEFVEETQAIVNMPGFKSKNEVPAKEDEAAKGDAGNGQPPPAASETSTFPAAKESSFSTDSVASPPTPVNPSSKNKLLTSQDLRPTYNDLDQLFDTSDEDCNDDPFQAPTPNGSLKPLGSMEDSLCGKNKTGDIIGLHGPTDISRMFPTPPSLEHNPTPSPGGPLGGTDASISESEATTVSAKERSEGYPSHYSPMEELITDWSYVYKPPSQAKFVGSSKYAPLTNLPSQASPPVTLPTHCVYKPSWQYPLPIIDKHPPSTHVSNISSVESIDRLHNNLSRSMEPSPATFPMGLDHRIPGSYELTSPASNASSYMNKNLNSIDNSGTVSHVPEAHGLLVNIVLSDSMLNLFRDHNFDGCTMCVCQMDVNGPDAGLYLPDMSSVCKDASYKCSCAFSAIVNRRHGHRAGLFYEDEVEITGIREDGAEKSRKANLMAGDAAMAAAKEGIGDDELSKSLEHVPQYLLELLRVQCTTLFSSCNILFKTSHLYQESILNSGPHSSEVIDGCEVAFAAVEQGRQAVDNVNTGKLDETVKMTCLHKWPHLKAKLPSNSHDIVRLLRTLQPLLQDAIQKKRTTGLWETTYSVSGPLTWRQFHRLVGRAGTEDQCEPQPIPSLLVGYDKDWLALSPFAVKYWEKLLLEPYSLARDIAYVVVAPDNDFILNNVRTFFKELSGTYEVCRLGRHCPITKVLRDGIIRVGPNSAKTLGKAPVDDWFNIIGESPLAAKLKLYAQVCGHHLAPHLAEQLMDRSLFDVPPVAKAPEKPSSAASPMPPPTPESSDHQVPTPKVAAENGDNADASSQIPPKDQLPGPSTSQDPWEQDDDSQVPAIVIYMVDPFTYGRNHTELHRLTTLGLLRCFAQVLRCLPDHMHSNVNLQIIPLESILNHTQGCDSSKQLDHLKSLAFSVFSQCRGTQIHQSTVKSLTGFGTAAQADAFLKTKDEKNSTPYRMYSPPYILAPMKDKQTELGESFGDRKEKCTILFCTYCLSEDQRCLLATCTDDRGEIMETAVINIEIPNRNRRKKASARKASLGKLMDWILGVMSTGVMPWRLIIGRLGRLGHGELKGWSNLLSRKYLVNASKHLKDICKQCFHLDTQDTPCILSACLVSTEPDAILRLMPDQLTPDERFGGSCNSCDLSTPQDASCTHLLVFPTSATTQSTQATYLPDPGLADDDDILDVLKEDLQEVDAIFDWTDSPVVSPTIGSPRKESMSLPGSPGLGVSGRQSPFQHVGPARNSDGPDTQEETPQLLQQPLALGYQVSTAKTGTLPKWFWASCSHLEDACPTFLKSALHIHSPSVQSADDLLQQHSHLRNYHPLDSNLTTDVLRYVLEGYNSLSWLSIDPVSHDRRSCLPVHIQVLMQLHFSLAPLV